MRHLFSDEIRVTSLDNDDIPDDKFEAFEDEIGDAWDLRTLGFAQQVKDLTDKYGVKGVEVL